MVVGGCGYVGVEAIPYLLPKNEVTVYDTQWFGGGERPSWPNVDTYKLIKGDVRYTAKLVSACVNHDVVIWLASISNNEMCKIHPRLSERVNFDAFARFVDEIKHTNVGRIIYASSVAAYGNSDSDATEATPLAPTTPYGDGKRDCENWLRMYGKGVTCITRSASVCGYSGRMRFDLTVNKMTHDAIRYGRIKVNGGQQKRSHIHILDLARAYRMLVEAPDDIIAGQVFNLVGENQAVLETAEIVAKETGATIEVGPSTDDRSYSVDGTKAKMVLDFVPKKSVLEAVMYMKACFDLGMWKDSENDSRYWNMVDGIV